jgi:hypothetical protein
MKLVEKILREAEERKTLADCKPEVAAIFANMLKRIPNIQMIYPEQMERSYGGQPNQCENNSFTYCKRRNQPLYSSFEDYCQKHNIRPEGYVGNMYKEFYAEYVEEHKAENGRFKIVLGHLFERGYPLEHWWVYDSKEKQFIEATPVWRHSESDVWFYIGCIIEDTSSIESGQKWFDFTPWKQGHPINQPKKFA